MTAVVSSIVMGGMDKAMMVPIEGEDSKRNGSSYICPWALWVGKSSQGI